MAVRMGDFVDPPDTGRWFGGGMEQFHHPRPVCADREGGGEPTPQRRQLLAGLSGRVLEIGAGDGVKLSCYPAGVEEIVLVEADPFLRTAAQRVAADLATPILVMPGDLSRLPVDDASCDAVVCSLVLCCAPRTAEPLLEVRRVLAPGGELRFYEHQRSGKAALALAESLGTPLWSRASGGCHPARDIVDVIRQAGFVIESLDRFVFRRFSHVLGAARPR
ncbi:class I SAM-dependent methyltransferase [Nonomuraea sp. K274]|uniref:Class I SAM-dependent methyltransferase n=1 Tax=Nonomuraea cypriaca TaxID=1187855 RepID=A0A931F5L2_9ACTN|nr:class I SAM-dependent methyltransferase [Nonomuraea cypriaca]MBF8193807.1 class I SAM-dependent methyltransferase [Nonomuraea cypriaca]